MSAVYALLVGINNYPHKPLSGCINDVNAVQECLQRLYGTALHVRRLTDQDEQPTRQNIINAFDFFKDAGNNDICLFYYSGHGSFSPAPQEFWTETDGYGESFVCIDSRMPGGRDLMDKEIGFLIARTMEGKPALSFIAITDCCHSGTITKALAEGNVTTRSYEASFTPRQLEDYLGFGEKVNGIPAYGLSEDGKRATPVQGRHIHIAAAQENQLAKELQIDGRQQGAFTYAFLKALYSSNGAASYNELFRQTLIQIKNTVAGQIPQINTNGGLSPDELDKHFLSAVSTSIPAYTVYWDDQEGWCIDAGSIHGLSVGDEVIVKDVCTTTVKAQTAPDYSVLTPDGTLVKGTRYKDVSVLIQPGQKIKIAFASDIPAVIRQHITTAYHRDAPKFVDLVTEGTPRYIIKHKDRQAFITLPADEKPVFEPVDFDDITFIDQVNKVFSWVHLQELVNPETDIPDSDYSFRLYRATNPGNYNLDAFEEVQDTDFYYMQKDSRWYQPALKLKITNHSQQELWFRCLYLGFNYSIDTGSLKEIRLPGGKEAWLTITDNKQQEQVAIKLQLDKEFVELGYREITEYLKIFISRKSLMDIRRFKQPGVNMPQLKTKSLVTHKSDAMRIGKRGWKTALFSLRIIRADARYTITSGKDTSVNNVHIKRHPSFEASFQISGSTSRVATKGTTLEPFDLLPGTRNAAATDMLELFDAKQPETVTSEQPLILSMPGKWQPEEESVIPIGYDEETGLYYPLGYSTDENRIVINTLPSATPSDGVITKKSLFGSIKIYFQKIVGKRLGLNYNYPLLRKVKVSDALEVTYSEDQLSKEVSKSDSIILFIHGIIGDTTEMVKCIKTALDDNGVTLEKEYQLTLAFDYENLHTPIEENAALLKEKLAEIGLDAGHGKRLTIVAHSMGGLVARWFIEQLGGNKVVSHLFMFGTPNNGTPWADIRDMAETLITYAINGASFLQPWMLVLNVVGKVTNGMQVSLKQMDSKTGIYDKLNTGTDPGVPYTIVSGNTQNIIVKFEDTATKITKLFHRIKKRGAYDALDLLLFKKPNDIAVTVESISTLKNSGTWKVRPVLADVATDHLNYFKQVEAVKKIKVTS